MKQKRLYNANWKYCFKSQNRALFRGVLDYTGRKQTLKLQGSRFPHSKQGTRVSSLRLRRDFSSHTRDPSLTRVWVHVPEYDPSMVHLPEYRLHSSKLKVLSRKYTFQVSIQFILHTVHSSTQTWIPHTQFSRNEFILGFQETSLKYKL